VDPRTEKKYPNRDLGDAKANGEGQAKKKVGGRQKNSDENPIIAAREKKNTASASAPASVETTPGAAVLRQNRWGARVRGISFVESGKVMLEWGLEGGQLHGFQKLRSARHKKGQQK